MMASVTDFTRILIISQKWATGPADSYTKFNEKVAVLLGSSGNHSLQVNATTLTEHDILPGTREAKNANNATVTLIGAKRSLGCQEKASADWLNITPHCFFRHLPDIAENVDVILAHGPENVWGALNIKETFYPDSKIILFNHVYPDNPTKADKKNMQEWAEKSCVVVSFDKETFEKYNQLYGKEMKVEHKLVNVTDLTVDLLKGPSIMDLDVPDGKIASAASPETPKPSAPSPKSPKGSPVALDDANDRAASTPSPKPAKLSSSPPKSPKGSEDVAAVASGVNKLVVRSVSKSLDWHNSVTPTLKKFHDEFAKTPVDAIKKAMPYFEGTMKKVEGKLKDRKMCVRFEYTGSAYEGVMINENDVEFDMMVIMSGGGDLQAEQFEDGTGGYFLLKPKPDCEKDYSKQIHTPESGVISPEKVVNIFFSALQKALNETGDTSKTKLRKHGPAVQMDVYHDVNKTQKWFSVDVVPAFQIKSGDEVQLYVAKPYKQAAASNQSWRRSFSVEEKLKYKTIDNGNGCRRMCIRILKAIIKPPQGIKRKTDSSFSHITSFMLKNTLFHLNDDTKVDWAMTKLGPRTIQLISQMAEFVGSAYFPHYYLPGVNIVAGLDDGPRQNLADRLQRLVSSEIEFRKVIGA